MSIKGICFTIPEAWLDPLVIWVCILLSLGSGLWLLNQLRAAIASCESAKAKVEP